MRPAVLAIVAALVAPVPAAAAQCRLGRYWRPSLGVCARTVPDARRASRAPRVVTRTVVQTRTIVKTRTVVRTVHDAPLLVAVPGPATFASATAPWAGALKIGVR